MSIFKIIAAIVISLLGAVLLYALLSVPVRPTSGPMEVRNNSDQKERGVKVEKLIDHFKISLHLPSKQVTLGDRLSFELSVENVSSEPRELSFNSGQKFDVWVKDESGREVWRWSHDRMFTQMFETVAIKPNKRISYTVDWPLVNVSGEPVSPGDYHVFTNVVAQELKEEVLELSVTIKPGR
ncbi:MAG TPA: BsuPI-related putative proteinase inhibitor [Anaerolineae bacterium]|nr:BsuPI-related putative proteinase inhibitor [Anaerolineae bacterium]